MIILNATNRSLQVTLAGAVTTNQLPIVASYIDNTTTAYTPASNNTATNNTTAVTAVAAPAASTQRQVKLLTVCNADTAAATVIVQYNDSSTLRVMFRATLQPGDMLVYTDGEGFRTLDASGQVKFNQVGPNGLVQFVGPTAVRYYTLPDANDTLAMLNQVNNYTKQYNATQYTTTTSVDWNNGNVQYIQLASGAQSFSFANGKGGARYALILKQPGSGAAGTVSWPGSVAWPAGSVPTLSAANNKVDLVAFVYDSANSTFYAAAATNF